MPSLGSKPLSATTRCHSALTSGSVISDGCHTLLIPIMILALDMVASVIVRTPRRSFTAPLYSQPAPPTAIDTTSATHAGLRPCRLRHTIYPHTTAMMGIINTNTGLRKVSTTSSADAATA